MNQINNTTNPKKNKYLTEKERYKIEALKKAKISNAEIAIQIGKSERTIRREIARGKVKLLNSDLTERYEYCADVAHRKYLENAANKGPSLKIGHDHKLASYIEDKIINEKHSPDVVIGRIKKEGLKFETSICTKTVYNYIDKGVFLNLSNKHLLVKRKGPKRKYRKVRKTALNNTVSRSIDERSKDINSRENLGHWEMDCVVSGRGSKTVLLVLTERKSRRNLIFKMKDKTQKSVAQILDKLERKHRYKFKKIFKSITMDNGCEFVNQEAIEKSILTKKNRTMAYYAHPYSSWERGSNENANKIIRRFIPKGVDISKYTNKEIKQIEYWINNYPRKILKYKTSIEVYERDIEAA
ncbi:IS30 family transposase [Vallitalea longa]|uniref:IS30 family transposase n=1 Tax=Vallitalea longa TaxID=2936439 RepID=A0A9W5YHI1_9FIRM|nr:IS30 family transposase [Vallitalea longa]GKX32378.1 IS30 family transposase [Vallitalea longa]